MYENANKTLGIEQRRGCGWACLVPPALGPLLLQRKSPKMDCYCCLMCKCLSGWGIVCLGTCICAVANPEWAQPRVLTEREDLIQEICSHEWTVSAAWNQDLCPAVPYEDRAPESQSRDLGVTLGAPPSLTACRVTEPRFGGHAGGTSLSRCLHCLCHYLSPPLSSSLMTYCYFTAPCPSCFMVFGAHPHNSGYNKTMS